MRVMGGGGTLAASGKPDREGEDTMEGKSTTVNSKGNGRGGRLERDWKTRAPLLQIPLKICRVCIAKQTQHVFWRRYSNSIIRRRYGEAAVYHALQTCESDDRLQIDQAI